MIQSGGYIGILNNFKIYWKLNTINSTKLLPKIANNVEDLFNKVTFNHIIKTADISKNFVKDFKKDFENISGTRVSLTNNEIKDIMIVIINSLENREILTKETTTKEVKKEDFLIFLMTTGLPLMKNVLVLSDKNVLIQQEWQQHIQLFERKFMYQVQQY